MAPDPRQPDDQRRNGAAKLRIAFIIGSAEVGGAEHLVLALIRSLPADEFDCSVICPPGPLLVRYAETAARVSTAGTRRGLSFLNPLAIVRIAALLRRWRIDVVHTSLYLSDVGGVVAARLARVPRVVSHIVGHNFEVTHPGGWRRLRQQLAARLYRGIYSLADHVIAASAAVKADLIERPGIRVPADKISVVHHALPPRDRAAGESPGTGEIRRRYGVASDAPLVVAIGSLFPVKGHEYLLEALAIARDAVPRLRCLIVGNGPARTGLEVIADRLGLRDLVQFTGVIDDGSRDAILASSDVLALPSVSEGLPVVLLEAMEAGKPIVATRIGGVPEIVVDGTTGVLVPPRDASALAAAIVRVVSDPPWAAQLGCAGRCRLEQKFSPDTLVDGLRRAYAQL